VTAALVVLLGVAALAAGCAGGAREGRAMGRGARPGRVLTERDRATLRALYAKPNGHRVTGPKRVD
jgi:hypothetical protein